MQIEIQGVARTITLKVTPEEAERILKDFDQTKEPCYETKQLVGALSSVAQKREFGGG